MSSGLNADEVRGLLRECVTVVRPGEVLVLRWPGQLSVEEHAHVTRFIEAWKAHEDVTLPVLILPDDVVVSVVTPE